LNEYHIEGLRSDVLASADGQDVDGFQSGVAYVSVDDVLDLLGLGSCAAGT